MKRKIVFAIAVLFSIGIGAYFLLFPRQSASNYVPEPVDRVTMECVEESVPLKWSYCVNRAEDGDDSRILYYLHARNGNATWWNDSSYHTGELYSQWRSTGSKPPVVVAVSFGPVWLLTENEPQDRSGLYHFFVDQVISKVEKRLGIAPAERMVAGISMGGFNSLILATKAKDVFTKAASICPPLPTGSHHDGIGYILKQYVSGEGSFRRKTMLWGFSRKFFPTEELWLKNDPLTLSENFDPEGAPEIYLTCGKTDDWGCMTGSEDFAGNIAGSGGEIQWVPRPGGHCDVDYQSWAEFLVEDE